MNWPVSLPRPSIDAMAFVGSWPHWPVPESDLPGLLRRMDRLGIQTAIVHSLANAYSSALLGNAELIELLRQHPGRLAGLAGFDPRESPSAMAALEPMRQAGMVGLVLTPANHGYALCNERPVEEALDLAEEWGWPVLVPLRLSMSWNLPVSSVDAVLGAAERRPAVPFILASCTYGEVDNALRSMKRLPNLHLEISGAQTLDAVRRLVQEGDSQRVLFGSGQPVQMPECSLIKVATADISEEDKAAILYGNARRLFRLP